MQTASILEKSASAFDIPAGSPGAQENRLFAFALALAFLTILYNAAEGLVSLYFGGGDESFALMGFGVDSFIEVLSGLGIAHMVFRIRRSPDSLRDAFERTALRITGSAFYLLTAGLIFSAAFTLYSGHRPEDTLAGFVISAVSILTMWLLLRAKRSVGLRLNSAAILADAECTRVCIYMSLVLLAASGTYMLFKVPFVDAAGCLGLAWFSFREGRECFEKAAGNAVCCDSCH